MGKNYISAGIVLGVLVWFGWIMFQTPGRKLPEPAPPPAVPSTVATPVADGVDLSPVDTPAPVLPESARPPAEVAVPATPESTPTASSPTPTPDASAPTPQGLTAPTVDIPALVKNSQPVDGPTTPALKALQGTFEGQLAASEFNKEPWTIELRNQWSDDGSGHSLSEHEISLNANGKVSQIKGTGPFEAARSTGPDGGLLIQVGPDMFMHLFYEPQTDDFSGLFYSIDAGQTRVHGKVVLTRK